MSFPPSPDGEDLVLSVPARPESVALVRRAVGTLARTVGFDEEGVADVALALSEACANVVIHAYRSELDQTLLEVRAVCTDDALSVVVADHGGGMAPRADSPGLGLGLPLMASLASTLELREARGGGTEVWMSFERRSHTPAPDPIPFGRSV